MTLYPSLDLAIAGQAVTIRQPHRKFGRCWAEFVGHVGNGKHVLVRKNITRDQGIDIFTARAVLSMWMNSARDATPEERAQAAINKAEGR